MGVQSGKFWGKTQGIFEGPNSEVHYLQIEQGGYCSKHRHVHKYNRFFLIEGSLKIIIYRPQGEDITILSPGDYTDVPPNTWHRFECLETSKCLEIYWVEDLDPGDIEREDTGGKKDISSNPGETGKPKTPSKDAAKKRR